MHAFEQLYRAYHPRLTRFLERLTRRPGLVGELLNDTMLVVWNRAGTYNGRCQVSTWIFAIAYRKAMKALQRWDEPVGDAAADEGLECLDRSLSCFSGALVGANVCDGAQAELRLALLVGATLNEEARGFGARDDDRLRVNQVVDERRQVRAGGEEALHQL